MATQHYRPSASRSGGMLMPPITWLFTDYERTVSTCPALLGICFATIIGYLLQKYFTKGLFERVAVFYPPTLRAGELWRLLTHVLLHSDMMHLLLNIIHVLNALDLEAVVPGSGYPSSYSLGSYHIARAGAVTASYGALVGSIFYFGAMFEGASALCFGLDGALLASCALLLGSGSHESFAGFFKVRAIYVIMHIGIDVARGCSNPQGTVGNLCHFAGFIAGICYVILAEPLLGGQPIPTVQCATPAKIQWSTKKECYAFFAPSHTIKVSAVRSIASVVIFLGVAGAVWNAVWRHRSVHPSADGYSVFCSPPRPVGDDQDVEVALARSRLTYAAEQGGAPQRGS